MPASCANAFAPHDRLVRLGPDSGHVREHLARRAEPLRDDARVEAVVVARQHAQCHHDLLERRVASALADPIHGALDLARAVLDPGERVGDREPEVVVAVHREHDLVDALHVRRHGLEHVLDVGGVCVAHGVGEVDRLRPGIDRDLHGLAQEVELRAGRVLAAELDVLDLPARARDRVVDAAECLVPVDLELALEVQVRGGEEGVDARVRRVLERLGRPVHVGAGRTRQARDDRPLDRLGDLDHALELLRRADGEAGLDDVHAEGVELLGDAYLLRSRHRRTRGLLAVPQGGVEHQDLLHAPCLRGGETKGPSPSRRGPLASVAFRPVSWSGSSRARSGPLRPAR